MKKEATKTKAARSLPVKTLDAGRAVGVKGGKPRKAGGDQPAKYLEYKLTDAYVTSISWK